MTHNSTLDRRDQVESGVSDIWARSAHQGARIFDCVSKQLDLIAQVQEIACLPGPLVMALVRDVMTRAQQGMIGAFEAPATTARKRPPAKSRRTPQQAPVRRAPRGDHSN